MFTVGKNDAADGDLIKRADGFADDSVSIVAGLAVRNDVEGRTRYRSSISLRGTNSSISIVRVDSSAQGQQRTVFQRPARLRTSTQTSSSTFSRRLALPVIGVLSPTTPNCRLLDCEGLN